MSSDPGYKNASKTTSNNKIGAVVKFSGNAINHQPPSIEDTSKNQQKLASSTGYGGFGASPNVDGTIKSKQEVKKLHVNSNEKVHFADELGPVVLNSDGSISRIKNWSKLTEMEQEKVKSKIMKRNAKRRHLLLQQEAKNDHNE